MVTGKITIGQEAKCYYLKILLQRCGIDYIAEITDMVIVLKKTRDGIQNNKIRDKYD